MKRSLLALLCLGFALFALPAGAVPALVTQEGLLLDANGVPIAGQTQITFAIFSEAQGGQMLWTETHLVDVADGYYSVQLGGINDIRGAFDGDSRFVEVAINGAAALVPRAPVNAVPFALTANNVTGDITPNSVWVGGQQVIDARGNWVGPPVGAVQGGVGYTTPQEVLAALVTVDGPNSQLDADTLDGVDGAAFVRTGAQVLGLLTGVDGAGSGVDADRIDGMDSSQFVTTGQQVVTLLRTVDGAGSQVDSDRLDGLDSAVFMRRDTDTGTVGALTVGGALAVTGTVTAAPPVAGNHAATKGYVDAALGDVQTLLGANDNNNQLDSSAVVGNENGSVLERLEGIKVQLDAIQAGGGAGGGGQGPYSSSCTDFAALGWASREACLRDGRWHRLGLYRANVGLPQGEFDLVQSLVLSGAEFKLRRPVQNGAIIYLNRIIPNCGAGRICVYGNREHREGLATFGLNVALAGGGHVNGTYWIGHELNIPNLNTMFTGTSVGLATGNMDYSLFVRASGWRAIGTFGGGVALTSAMFDEIKALVLRGVDFRIRSNSTNYNLVHEVVRVIPDCGANCMWFYLQREDDGQGFKSFGMTVSRDGNNGRYWIGNPVPIGNLTNFFSGTNGAISTGTHRYTLLVNE